jgi:hypothetical protein
MARRLCCSPDVGSARDALGAWEDDVSTFLFLAFFSTFVLGMAAGALTRGIVD